MVLKFFGRGAENANENTSAYFTTENKELVIIDCTFSAYQKLKKMDLTSYEKIYILITHTHAGKISGLSLFLKHAYFNLNKQTIVVVPNEEVSKDIKTLFEIVGNELSWCKLITADDNGLWETKWFYGYALTEHSPRLKNKCCGYEFIVDGINVIYTGDTSTLEPFGFMQEDIDGETQIYVDTTIHEGKVHLKLKDHLDELKKLAEKGIKVYLMHLDDIEAAEEIIKDIPNIEVVPVV